VSCELREVAVRTYGTPCGLPLEFEAVAIDLFAGIAVRDYAAAVAWYERLFGSPPSFLPTETEAVWELGEHRYVFIEQRPDNAGHARHLLFVDDLDARIAKVAERGLEPAERETLANGVRKITYRDLDGNEFGFGGAGAREP
jgi:predicted enzyme related to lactoylglutathione lyase